MAFSDKLGFSPELRREVVRTLELQSSAMSGDLILQVTPTTSGSSAAAVTAAIAGPAAKYVRTVKVELVNTAGDIHEWFTGTFSVAGTEVTAGNGTAPTAAATVSLVNGVGYIDQEYVGAWALGDTATVTVTGGTKLGYSITNKTSVDTLIA